MLGNETLWDAATRCHEVLQASGISHVIVDEVAVCLHGHRRNAVDVDLPVHREDTEAIQILLNAAGCEWSAKSHEFLSPSGVPIEYLLADDRVGHDGDVRFPDPRVATPSKHTQVANTRPPTRHKNAALQQNLVRGITCSNTGIGNGSVQAVFFVF